jgi:hypothetical protein
VLSETDDCRHEGVLRFAHPGGLAINNAVSTVGLTENMGFRNLCYAAGSGAKVCRVVFILIA